MSDTLNIGMIGYGFMGRAHSNAYATVANFFDCFRKPVLKAVCARNEENAQAFANQWGYESVETDWRKLIERDDIDAVDIVFPTTCTRKWQLQLPTLEKWVLCEKPLAMNTAEAKKCAKWLRKQACPTWFGTTTDVFLP